VNGVVEEVHAYDDEQKKVVVLAAFLVEGQQMSEALLLALVRSPNRLSQDVANASDERCGDSS
jgi:hypothetical protein